MTTPGAKRKLTAILSADVKGYSRLMEDDEEATVATLTAYKQVMAKVIEKHRGRVVETRRATTCSPSSPVWWTPCGARWRSKRSCGLVILSCPITAGWSSASGSTSGT